MRIVRGNFLFLSWAKLFYVHNPLTPISDQERISPYKIHTISSNENKGKSIRGLSVDPVTNSQN